MYENGWPPYSCHSSLNTWFPFDRQVDPVFPGSFGHVQHVCQLPMLWPESGVDGWRQWALSGDHRFHFPEPRFSAAIPQGLGDPAFPDPRGSIQHVRSLPVLWPESGVGGGSGRKVGIEWRAGSHGIPVIRGTLEGVSSGWTIQGPGAGTGMSQGDMIAVLVSWHVLVYRWAP